MAGRYPVRVGRTAAPLVTDRLELVPLALEEAEALLHGHRPAEDRWAPDYPTDAALVAAGLLVTVAAEGPELGPWTAYQVLRDGIAIGGVGFPSGPPDEHGEVQVGFSIVDSERGHGYEAEAVRAMVAFAREQGAARVVAETAEANGHGVATYEAAGLRRVGEHDGLVTFQA